MDILLWLIAGAVGYHFYSKSNGNNSGRQKKPKYYRDKNDKVVSVKQYGTFVTNVGNKFWMDYHSNSMDIPNENDIRLYPILIKKRTGCNVAAKVIVKKVSGDYVHEWHTYADVGCPEDEFYAFVSMIHNSY